MKTHHSIILISLVLASCGRITESDADYSRLAYLAAGSSSATTRSQAVQTQSPRRQLPADLVAALDAAKTCHDTYGTDAATEAIRALLKANRPSQPTHSATQNPSDTGSQGNPDPRRIILGILFLQKYTGTLPDGTDDLVACLRAISVPAKPSQH